MPSRCKHLLTHHTSHVPSKASIPCPTPPIPAAHGTARAHDDEHGMDPPRAGLSDSRNNLIPPSCSRCRARRRIPYQEAGGAARCPSESFEVHRVSTSSNREWLTLTTPRQGVGSICSRRGKLLLYLTSRDRFIRKENVQFEGLMYLPRQTNSSQHLGPAYIRSKQPPEAPQHTSASGSIPVQDNHGTAKPGSPARPSFPPLPGSRPANVRSYPC